MTARAPVGAANRAELFSNDQDYQGKNDEDKVFDDANSSGDPLQLEHMLGYAGDYRSTVLALPYDENLYIKRYSLFIRASLVHRFTSIFY